MNPIMNGTMVPPCPTAGIACTYAPPCSGNGPVIPTNNMPVCGAQAQTISIDVNNCEPPDTGNCTEMGQTLTLPPACTGIYTNTCGAQAQTISWQPVHCPTGVPPVCQPQGGAKAQTGTYGVSICCLAEAQTVRTSPQYCAGTADGPQCPYTPGCPPTYVCGQAQAQSPTYNPACITHGNIGANVCGGVDKAAAFSWPCLTFNQFCPPNTNSHWAVCTGGIGQCPIMIPAIPEQHIPPAAQMHATGTMVPPCPSAGIACTFDPSCGKVDQQVPHAPVTPVANTYTGNSPVCCAANAQTGTYGVSVCCLAQAEGCSIISIGTCLPNTHYNCPRIPDTDARVCTVWPNAPCPVLNHQGGNAHTPTITIPPNCGVAHTNNCPVTLQPHCGGIYTKVCGAAQVHAPAMERLTGINTMPCCPLDSAPPQCSGVVTACCKTAVTPVQEAGAQAQTPFITFVFCPSTPPYCAGGHVQTANEACASNFPFKCPGANAQTPTFMGGCGVSGVVDCGRRAMAQATPPPANNYQAGGGATITVCTYANCPTQLPACNTVVTVCTQIGCYVTAPPNCGGIQTNACDGAQAQAQATSVGCNQSGIVVVCPPTARAARAPLGLTPACLVTNVVCEIISYVGGCHTC